MGVAKKSQQIEFPTPFNKKYFDVRERGKFPSRLRLSTPLLSQGKVILIPKP